MDMNRLIKQMANSAESIRSLTQGVSDEQARWKPDSTSWSILEVINHLYDEEREDFRPRLDGILYHPERLWSANNPEAWVTERAYNQRDLAQSIRNFMNERQESLAWLQTLEAPDWEASYAARFGRITAGDMFASWVAHDLLHLRQLVELHWYYLGGAVEPHKVHYAGDW